MDRCVRDGRDERDEEIGKDEVGKELKAGVVQYEVDPAGSLGLAGEPRPDRLLVVAEDVLLLFVASLLELGDVLLRGRAGEEGQVCLGG